MIAQQSRECIWPTLKMAVDFPDEMEVVAIPVSILVFLMASTFSLLLFVAGLREELSAGSRARTKEGLRVDEAFMPPKKDSRILSCAAYRADFSSARSAVLCLFQLAPHSLVFLDFISSL